MKRNWILSALAGFLCAVMLVACGGALAANPELVKATNASNTPVVVGGGQIYSVDRDLSQHIVMVRIGGGLQYMKDDGGWSVFTKLVAACGARCVAVPGSATGMVVNAVDGITYCQGNGSWSQVGYPYGPAIEMLGDGCAFYNAVKAQAQ